MYGHAGSSKESLLDVTEGFVMNEQYNVFWCWEYTLKHDPHFVITVFIFPLSSKQKELVDINEILFDMMKITKYSIECWCHNSSNLARVPALVHNPRPPEVAHDAVGEPALDTDGVHPLVELADPLPPAHPAVLRLARRNHSLKLTNSYQNRNFLTFQMQR